MLYMSWVLCYVHILILTPGFWHLRVERFFALIIRGGGGGAGGSLGPFFWCFGIYFILLFWQDIKFISWQFFSGPDTVCIFQGGHKFWVLPYLISSVFLLWSTCRCFKVCMVPCYFRREFCLSEYVKCFQINVYFTYLRGVSSYWYWYRLGEWVSGLVYRGDVCAVLGTGISSLYLNLEVAAFIWSVVDSLTRRWW